jgi:hypothetical protein
MIASLRNVARDWQGVLPPPTFTEQGVAMLSSVLRTRSNRMSRSRVTVPTKRTLGSWYYLAFIETAVVGAASAWSGSAQALGFGLLHNLF